MDFSLWDDYCFFMDPKNGFPLMTKEEYELYLQFDEEYQAEMDAESAWLRSAEAATYEDMAFEKYEHERMFC